MEQTLITKRSCCRLCDNLELRQVLPMRPSPIGDAFIPVNQKDKSQTLFSLDLYQCQRCGHAQNIDVVNPELLFREYLFTTGSSFNLVNHFSQYAKEVINRFSLPKSAFVVEIGSNDGTLLQFFKNSGMHVLGVDPAASIAKEATDRGLPTLAEFFSLNVAKYILNKHGPAELILANNVYAHSDHLADITEGIANLIAPNGLFIFEVSYLLDIIDRFLFDTIYHEHLSYHSITPLLKFFQRYDLELFDIQKIESKGGSIRCFVQKSRGPYQKSPVVDQMVAGEKRRGLHDPKIFQQYEMQIREKKEKLHAYLHQALVEGKKVAGYGASTTVTTLMYQFELEDKLCYLIDDNPKKHGLLSPGCHLAVKPNTALYEEKPDVVVILAWQYAQSILQKHGRFIEENGIFVIPLPELRII